MNRWSSANDVENWKIVDEEGVILKVVDFPSEHKDLAGESMWVRVVEGDDYDGYGHLDNHPMLSDLKCGDLVRYGGGTDDEKPHYRGLVGEDKKRLVSRNESISPKEEN